MMQSGSSPLARGTRKRSISSRLRMRLIPARAGNTAVGDDAPVPVTAHPRSRGEHAGMCEAITSRLGSSPLARGTLPATDAYINAWRLIPARAGNTSSLGAAARAAAAHPRSRGEHADFFVANWAWGGSSPLARGTRSKKLCNYTRNRLIPARAGNTQARGRAHLKRAAHPRSRGEHKSGLGGKFGEDGSSPLARGTPYSGLGTEPRLRLIPARAGNTGYEY